MSRLISLLLTILAAFSYVSVNAAENKAPPNVVVILVDDLGYGDLSIYGGPNVQTPRIDSLGKEGMQFTQFRANSNVCSPTRAALLSGMYPDRAGVPGVIRTYPEDSWGYLSQDLTLLPAALRNYGYTSAHIGKWHLGLEAPNLPTRRGFDFFHGFLGDMMEDYYNHLRHGINYMRKNEQVIDPEGHATDLFSSWASDYLRERAADPEKKPFFLYLAYNAPHDPIQPPPEYLQRVLEREPGIDEKRAKLVALIEHLDDGIGRVLDTIKETGLDQNTLILFTSDNGGSGPTNAFNGPHRGAKGEMYEGGLKVACLVKWPGKIKPESKSDVQGATIDIFPTLLKLAGGQIDEEQRSADDAFIQRIDGINLADVLLGKSQTIPERTLYFVRRNGELVRGAAKTNNAMIRGEWKILQNSAYAPLEFYNLKNDPLETTDVRTKAPAEFQKSLRQMMLHIQEGGRTPWQPPRGAKRPADATKALPERTGVPKFVISPPGKDESRALKELVRSPELWVESRKHVDAINVADHVVNRHFKDDKELAELFDGFRKMNLPIHMEVGAVKPWGKTGKECFERQKPQWERFIRLNADIRGISMDEPLNCCDTHLKMDNAMEYAATETAEFIALVRKDYPDWVIGDIEGYPALSIEQTIQWIDLLEAKLKAKGVRGMDFFRLDVDWMHFVHDTGKGNWQGVKQIENHCRSKNIPFSFVYWAANYPSLDSRGLASDRVWYVGAMQMYFDYLAVNGNPDQVVVQSWVNGPNTILPESEPFSFVRSVGDIADHWTKVKAMNNARARARAR